MGQPRAAIGIVGVTGLVGSEILRLLEERQFPVERIHLYASEASRALRIEAFGRSLAVDSYDPSSTSPPSILFVATPPDTATAVAARAAQAGSFVIDVSGQAGLGGMGPVVVPEINFDELTPPLRVVAIASGPATPLALALEALRDVAAPLHVEATLLLPASSAGKAAMEELAAQTINLLNQRDIPREHFPQRLAFNAIPDAGGIGAAGENSRTEQFVAQALRIVLDDDSLGVDLTAVYVPVFAGAAAVVRVELHRATERAPVVEAFERAGALALLDDPAERVYPMPGMMAERNEVAVGRVRVTGPQVHFVLAWDNLRRGAALDAVVIAEGALGAGWVRS